MKTREQVYKFLLRIKYLNNISETTALDARFKNLSKCDVFFLTEKIDKKAEDEIKCLKHLFWREKICQKI